MKIKDVDNFFESLIKESKNEKLSLNKIQKIVKDSNLDNDVKIEILSRLKEHEICEKQTEENMEYDEYAEDITFVVSNYAGVNCALECQECYSVIIDNEILYLDAD